MTNNDEVDEGTFQKWDDRYVHLLIAAYDHHKHLFKSSRGKVTKKQVFQKIAEYFNANADVTVSAGQCLRKWTKLEQKYKEVEDNNNRTGNGRKDWKFLENMTACLGQSPKVNPAFTFDASAEHQESRSASQSGNSTTDNGNCSDSSGDDDENVLRKKLNPRRQRKRKSNSSAAEMLTFLQTYTEKREKAEEEKLNLLREMKDDKKKKVFQPISGDFKK